MSFISALKKSIYRNDKHKRSSTTSAIQLLVMQICNQPIAWQQLMWSRQSAAVQTDLQIGEKKGGFECGVVVGARHSDLCISEAAELLGFSCVTISKDCREL